MLYVACEVTERRGERVDAVKVVGVSTSRRRVDSAAEFARVPGVETMVLPVSMARLGSVRPKEGSVLGVMSEASGLVAVATVRS